MDDLKIIFYIAIAIAWLILRNYQKVQKSRPVIKEFTDEPEAAEPIAEIPVKKKKPVRQEWKPMKRNIIQKKPVRQFLDFEKKISSFDPAKSADLTEKDLHSVEPYATVLTESTNDLKADWNLSSDNFELKKAIIYSEILKRPVA